MMRLHTHGRTPISVFGALLALACLGAAARAGGDRWRAPDAETPPAQLPKLTQPLVLDGDLTEWDDAACVPVRLRGDVRREIPPRKWRGPADASMEVYCAWNPEGLCLAAVVSDDDVRNRFRRYEAHKQDSLHLLVDGRGPDRLMKPPCSPGVFTIIVVPPLNGNPPLIHVDEPEGADIAGVKVGGRPTRSGYQVEAVIPWGGFPELTPKPGTAVGLQFGLHDYDARDGEADYPLALSYQAASDLDESPQKYIKWVLIDQAEVGPDVALGPEVRLDTPSAGAGEEALSVSLEMGSLLSRRVGSVDVRLEDSEGKTIIERQGKPTAAPAPWDACRRLRLDIPSGVSADGWCTLTATLVDSAGRPLGRARQPVLFVRGTLREGLARLRAADIPSTSRADPFKAAAYVGAAACLERLRYYTHEDDGASAAAAARELSSRLELLEKGRLIAPPGGLCDLLILAAEPEAQVVVEFPGPDSASVTFYCGSLPLASVRVAQMESAQWAAKVAAAGGGGLVAAPSEETTVGGRPARLVTRMEYPDFDLREFDPSRQIVAGSFKSQYAAVLNVEEISAARADAVLILSGCPESVRARVEAWAAQNNVTIIGLDQASNQDLMLVAGNVHDPAAATIFAPTLMVSAPRPSAGPRYLQMAVGDRFIHAESAVENASRRAVELVVRGQPIAPDAVDAMRADLVAALAPDAVPPGLPGSAKLFCGDVHMHTCYSDGQPSPMGLMLQAMHCYMDFAVMTDHNTVASAQEAQRLLRSHGFDYPIIVGEEITTECFHMNAYPLRTAVSPDLSPQETIEQAHAQGAVVQWNHPYSPQEGKWKQWADTHLEQGIAGTGLDAWEHFPPKYEEWRAAGTAPLVVGSTDTHTGTFEYRERTIIRACEVDGNTLADAIRRRRAAAVLPEEELVYGPARMVSFVWAALADGDALKQLTAERLKRTFAHADLAGLLEASPPGRAGH